MSTASQLLNRLTAEAAASGDDGRCRHIRLGRGVLGEMPAWLAQARPATSDMLICDEHTYAAAGEQLETHLAAAGRAVRRITLEPHGDEPDIVCEDGVIDAMTTFLSVSERLNPIAVGAGTINDIVKAACHRIERPFQVVPTAASMNGYTSSIAAVLSDGVKRTSATRQAEAVFADVDVIRDAPLVMSQAGLGDLLSKPYSHADWLVSHLVRGVPYSEHAAQILDEPWNRMVDRAAGIGVADPDAVEVLMETILVSGFSMALAGTSAPASGGEHLVSHYWDMEAHCQDRPVRALHGTQVGIGTRLSGLLLNRLVALEGLEHVDIDAAVARRDDDGWLRDLDASHPHLTAPVLAEVREQIATKQLRGEALRAELEGVRERWPEIRQALTEVVLPAERVTSALAAAGCPAKASDIGVSREHLVRTLNVCRHIRTRYTGLDLIDDLGLLETWSQQVAAETEGD